MFRQFQLNVPKTVFINCYSEQKTQPGLRPVRGRGPSSLGRTVVVALAQFGCHSR